MDGKIKLLDGFFDLSKTPFSDNIEVIEQKKLEGKDRYKKLYHYTSFGTFVRIWLNKQLRFSSLSGVNDINEIDYSVFSNNSQQLPLYHAFFDLRISYKQISLTMDYDSYVKGCMSPVMWGVYADKRNGVCIELDYDKLKLSEDMLHGPIHYGKIMNRHQLDPDIRTIRDLHNYMIRNKKDLMFTKDDSWSYENEYRILSRTEKYLDISGAVSAVYLTSCTSDECLFTEKLVNGQVPVKFLHYQKGNSTYPIVSDTKISREKQMKADKNKTNRLKIIFDQSKSFYEAHKNDWDFEMIKVEYNI